MIAGFSWLPHVPFYSKLERVDAWAFDSHTDVFAIPYAWFDCKFDLLFSDCMFCLGAYVLGGAKLIMAFMCASPNLLTSSDDLSSAATKTADESIL